MKYRILIADDEAEIRSLLRLYLENETYEIEEAADGEEALHIFREKDVDLCVLDVMMPKVDGFHVLKEIRQISTVPVIMLSAKREDTDKILGLNLGADDYLAKPFNPLEAVARVHAAIRRYASYALKMNADLSEAEIETKEDKMVLHGEFSLDTDACTLYKREQEIPLSAVEYRIMEQFLRHPGKVYTKQQIYEIGWEEQYVIADNNIMVCISKLRSKLDEDPMRYIKTIRGLGYRFEK